MTGGSKRKGDKILRDSDATTVDEGIELTLPTDAIDSMTSADLVLWHRKLNSSIEEVGNDPLKRGIDLHGPKTIKFCVRERLEQLAHKEPNDLVAHEYAIERGWIILET